MRTTASARSLPDSTTTPRQYQPTEATRVQTPLGPLDILPRDGEVLAFTPSNSGTYPELQFGPIRGVSYVVHIRLIRQPDGTLSVLNPGESPREEHNRVSICRANWTRYSEAYAISKTTRQTILAAVIGAAARVLAEQPDLARRNSLRDLNNAAGSLGRDLEKARAKVAELERQLAEVEAQMAALAARQLEEAA
jgi:hypothetical protein